MIVSNNITKNIISNNKYRFTVFFLVYSIPLVLIFDWLIKLDYTSFPLGIVFKGITILFNLNLFLTKETKIGKFKFGKIALFYLFLNIIYAMFSNEVIQNLYLSIRILYWVSTSISIFFLYKNNLISVSKLKYIFITTTILGSLFTIYLMSDSVKHQNASAYLLLWCFPILLLFKQTFLLRLVQFLGIISIVLTIKRGAIIALLISIVCYVFGSLIINNKIKNKIKTLFLGLVFLLFSFSVIFSNQDRFIERFEDKTGSGRDIVYSNLIDTYFSSDLDNLIFGYGFKGVENHLSTFLHGNSEESGPAAHSDLLQNMFDFGFFGIFFMLLLHLFIINLIRVNLKLRSRLFPIILMYYSIFFLTTIYSFILNVPDAIFFGISAAIFSEETNRIKRSYHI
jgi:hypothetical protein